MPVIITNRAPLLANPIAVQSFNEDTPYSFTFNSNVFNDPDGDALTYSASGLPTWLTFNAATRTFTGTPPLNYNGNMTITVTATDKGGLTAIDTFVLTVLPVNDAPTASNGTANATEDTVLTGTLPDAADVDGDTVTYSLGTQAANGVVSVNANGSYTYTPNANYNGTDSFTYTVSDGKGGSDTYTITINVAAVNDAPTASNGTANATEDTVLTGTLPTAADVDGDTVTYSLGTQAANGVVSVNANGSYTYTPNANYNGSDSFTYTVSDGKGGSNTYTITINVAAVNDAPTASNGTANATEDTVLAGTLPAATDVDGDTVTYSLGTQAANGVVSVNANGSYTYTPNANYNGSDSFTYTVSDGKGGSNTYTITVNVEAVNNAPVVSAPVVLSSIDEDSAGITFSAAELLANASDIDSEVLYVVDLALADETQGTIIPNQDGTWTFVPAPDFNGTVSFTYKVSDGELTADGSASLEVEAVNDAPVVSGAVVLNSIVEDSEGLTFSAEDLLANASDVDSEVLTITGVALADETQGTLTDNEDGTWTFVPAADFNGTVSLTYTVSDGELTADGSASLEVEAVNDAPVVSGAVVLEGIAENSAGITFSATELLANASDIDSEVLTVSGVALADETQGTLTDNQDGTWTFVPAADFNGTVSFTYTVSDGELTADGSASLEVDAVNDAPVVSAPVVLTSIDEDSAGVIITAEALLANASDIDSEILSVVDLALADETQGTLTDNEDGTWTFVPAADFNGTVNFTYKVSDGELTADGSASLEVKAVNDAPVVSAPVVLEGTDENSAGITFSAEDLLANASDVDSEVLSVVDLALADESQGTLTDNEDGTWTFVPAANFNGTVSFTYKVSDGELTADGSASLEVGAVNDAPVVSGAVELGNILEDNEGFTFSAEELLANASDVDSEVLSIVDLALADETQGTLTDNEDGTWTFVPAADFNGTVDFTYTVSDGELTADGSASLEVDAVNDAPVVSGAVELGNILEDSEEGITFSAAELLANASDIDSEVLTVTDVALADETQGTIIPNQDGTWTFVPAPNFNGTVNFTYTVSDGELTADGSASLEVEAVNDAPVVSAPVVLESIVEDSEEGITFSAEELLANASDIDSEVLTVSAVALADTTQGTLTDNQDGTWTFVPAPDFNGTVNFTYTVSDGDLTTEGSAVLNVENDLADIETEIVQEASPAADAQAQVSTVTLAGTPEVGDTYSITIDGEVFELVVPNDADIDYIGQLLTNRINNHSGLNVTAEYDGGVITLTANTAGTGFEVIASAVNGVDGTNDSDVNVVTVTPNVSYSPATPQVDVITISADAIDAGDRFFVTFDGYESIEYVAEAGDTAEKVAEMLTLLINSKVGLATLVTAVQEGSDIRVTADAAGTGFEITDSGAENAEVGEDISVVDNDTLTYQVNTVDLGDEDYQPGDSIVITVEGEPHSFPVAAGQSIADIADSIINHFSSSSIFNVVFEDGELVFTSKTAGTEYDFAANVTNIEYDEDAPVNAVLDTEGVAATPQSTLINLGTVNYNAGDTITVTVASVEYPYEVQPGDSLQDILDFFRTTLFGDGVTVTGYGSDSTGYFFELGSDVPVVIESSVQKAVFSANSAEDMDIELFQQATIGSAGVKQVSSVSFDNATVVIGETYTLTISDGNGSANFAYTAAAGNSWFTVLNKLAAQINADSSVNVTAVRSGSVLFVTAGTAGYTFSVDSNDQDVTENILKENLAPSVSLPQITSLDLGSVPFDEGDVVSVSVNGQEVASYTVQGGDSVSDVALGLEAAAAGGYTIIYDGVLLISGQPGESFTVTSDVVNASPTESDTTYDTTEASPAVAEVYTFDLTDTEYDAGDIITLYINGNEVSYTVQAGDSAEDIAAGLALSGSDYGVTAVGNIVSVTGDEDGSSFTEIEMGVENFGLTDNSEDFVEPDLLSENVEEYIAREQVDEVTFSNDTLNVGDRYEISILLDGEDDPVTISYLVSDHDVDMDDVLNALVAKINSNDSLPYAVADGLTITLTARTAGQGFETESAHAINSPEGEHDDNGLAVNSTAEAAAIQDQITSFSIGEEGDTFDIGDIITVTIEDEASYTYTVERNEMSLEDVVAEIILALNLSPSVMAAVDPDTPGGIILSSGSPFGVTVEVEDGSFTNDTDVSVGTTQTGETPRPQITALTIADDDNRLFDKGDTVTVTINEGEVNEEIITYTVESNGMTLAEVAEAAALKITDESGLVSAESDNGQIILTSSGNTSFTVEGTVADAVFTNNTTTSESSVSDGEEVQVQITYINIGDESDTFDRGDVITVTIEGELPYVYSIDENGVDWETAAQAVADLINADSLIATAEVQDGHIVLTGRDSDTPVSFTVTASVGDGVFSDNESEVAVTSVQAAQNESVPVKQVSIVNFDSAAPGAYSIDIDGTVVTYNALGSATLNAILNGLALRINNSSSLDVTAIRDGHTLVITANVAGTGFDIDDVTAPVGATHSTPTANSTGHPAQVEISEIDFGTTDYDAGDSVSVTIGGVTETFPLENDTDAEDFAQLVLEAFQGVNIVRNGSVLTVTGSTTGVGLNIAVTVTDYDDSENEIADAVNDAAAGAQDAIDTASAKVYEFTLSGAEDDGDSFTVDIDGEEYTVVRGEDGDSLDDLGLELAALINLDTADTGISASYVGGVLTVTGPADGSDFTAEIDSYDYEDAGNVAVIDVETSQTPVVSMPQVNTYSIPIGADLTVSINGEAAVTVTADTVIEGVAVTYDALTGALVLTSEAGVSFEAVVAVDKSEVTLLAQDSVTAPVSKEFHYDMTEYQDYNTLGDGIFVSISATAYGEITLGPRTFAQVVAELNFALQEDGYSAEFDGTTLIISGPPGIDFIIDELMAIDTGLTYYPTFEVEAAAPEAVVYDLSEYSSLVAGDSIEITIDGDTDTFVFGTHFNDWDELALAIESFAKVSSVDVSGDTLTIHGVDNYAVLWDMDFTVSSTFIDNDFAPDSEVPAYLGTPQINEYTLEGAGDEGDSFTVDIDGEEYTVVRGEDGDSLDELGLALVARINLDTLTTGVTASYVGGVLTLTGSSDGTEFEASVTASDYQDSTNEIAEFEPSNVQEAVAANVAQVTEITFDGTNTIEWGDVYRISVTLDGNTYDASLTVAIQDPEDWYAILDSLGLQLELFSNGDITYTIEEVIGEEDAAQYKLVLAGPEGLPFTVDVDGVANRAEGDDNTEPVISELVTNQEAQTPQSQSVVYDFNGKTFDAGDVLVLTIDNVDYEYVVTGEEADNGEIATNLAGAYTGSAVTPSVSNGRLTLLAAQAGVAFDYGLAVVDIVHRDNTVTVSEEEISSRSDIAQVSTVQITGAVEAGDVYTLVLGGFEVSYTVSGEEEVGDILSALVDALIVEHGADLLFGFDVVESVTGSEVYDRLVVTELNAGDGFELAGSVVNRAAGIDDTQALTVVTETANSTEIFADAKVAAVTFEAGTIEAGDTYNVVINGETISYTLDGDEEIGDIIAELIDRLELFDSDGAFTFEAVQSVEDGAYDTIKITANTAGEDFTLSADVINRPAAVIDDNDADAVTITPNISESEALPQIFDVTVSETNFADGDTLVIGIDITGDGWDGDDLYFSAIYGEGGIDSLAALLGDIAASINNEGGFTAQVEDNVLKIIGQPDSEFDVQAHFNLI